MQRQRKPHDTGFSATPVTLTPEQRDALLCGVEWKIDSAFVDHYGAVETVHAIDRLEPELRMFRALQGAHDGYWLPATPREVARAARAALRLVDELGVDAEDGHREALESILALTGGDSAEVVAPRG
jgi:hypothetical protein